MHELVVFGATGYAGGKILGEAVSRGHRVTAVARTASSVEPGANVRAVTGSLYDEAFVHKVSEGADVLVVAIPASPAPEGMALPDATAILVSAAQRNGVRIAVVGGASSLLLADGGEQVLSTQLDYPAPILREIELQMEFLTRLRETPADVDWFYLSPPVGFGAHVPGRPLGRYRLGGDVMLADEQGDSAISGEDFATAFLDEIETPAHRRRRFTVAY